MKKAIAIILVFLMALSMFASCSKKEAKTDAPTDSGNSSNPPAANTTLTSSGIELTRYPAETGKSNYSRPEGMTLWTIDKDAVKPSPDATARMACTGAPSSLCVLTNLGTLYAGMPMTVFFDSLLYYDSVKGELVPGLATEWEWTDDYTVRLKIREGVKSHLGDPFTANDVKFTIDWGCETPSLLSGWGAIFDTEKTKVIDDYTIDIVYKNITPFALYDLSRPQTYPMAVQASVEKLGGKEACGSNPSFGTGPYKLSKWDQTNQAVYAERNEDYWAALPYFKYYELYTITDTTARCMGVEAGDYDFAQSPSANSVIALMDNEDIATYATGGAQTMRWDLNTDREPLNVKEVRQALAMAVNYDAIKKVVYQGFSDPGDSVIPYSLDWHSSPAEGEKEFYYYFDIARAKEKLIEAGYADGFELSIMFTSGLSDLVQAIEILQNGLQQIGIKVQLEQFESATFNERRNKHEYQSMMANPLNTSPASTLKQIDPRLQNWVGSGWVNGREDEIYTLIDNCMTTLDLDKSYEYLAEFQDLYRELCPSIVLASQKNYNMINGDIVNIAYDFTGNLWPSCSFKADYLG